MTKENLAKAYHILSHLGMDDHTYTHLSARPSGADYFYIYPFGLRFEEVTPETLMKISLDGKVLEGQEYQYNKTGYTIHGAIYKSRSDINAIFHTHTIASAAVSSMEAGLMPINQWALHFYDRVSYHDYNSLALDESVHGSQLTSDLGKNFTMLLRNHGSITCGRTIWEAMFYTYHLEKACLAQLAALQTGQPLVKPSREVALRAVEDILNFEKDLGARDWAAWVRLIERAHPGIANTDAATHDGL